MGTRSLFLHVLVIIFFTISPNWVWAEAYSCKDLLNITLSPYALDPQKAIVATLDQSFSEEDLIEEKQLLGQAYNQFNNVDKRFSDRQTYVSFSRSQWERLDSKISSAVRRLLYSTPEFIRDLSQKNFHVNVSVQKFSEGDYADDLPEETFHIDSANKPDSPTFIINISAGDAVVAPTAIYTGPDFPGLEEAIRNNRLRVTLPPAVSHHVYTLRNGQVLRFTEKSLHKRTSAETDGFRYFVRITSLLD